VIGIRHIENRHLGDIPQRRFPDLYPVCLLDKVQRDSQGHRRLSHCLKTSASCHYPHFIALDGPLSAKERIIAGFH
jgi:hypothetical protein